MAVGKKSYQNALSFTPKATIKVQQIGNIVSVRTYRETTFGTSPSGMFVSIFALLAAACYSHKFHGNNLVSAKA